MTKSIRPTVVCAWCNRLMASGTGMVSHGICHECARSFMSGVTDKRTRGVRNRPYPIRNRKTQD